ncbi:enoyl-CoA hydratase-related protein [Mycobacterium arosiense]|uniref:Enoyl-CoA hydratase n=1 Tax=Mycobacterium arosiense ATCC BAA-1401 = DSM 45069 TaxID=1265311 RepID=A0A1W9ZC25_MYCAI|nr:enoyl-CoA hydratase-related protein [Mycobacterium arosiense]ORA11662.1 hypothetical protein BST14_18285 [Mycobacterium arosiense ATCC BAA-1401 = DSM 45069]
MVDRPLPTSGDQEFTQIRYRIQQRIAHVTLACPQSANALSMTMRLELVAALRRAQSDEKVRVVVLDGDGSTFCSGYDLGAPYGSSADRAARPGWISDRSLRKWTDPFARSCLDDWLVAWDLLKPIVAVVQGNCLGGGTELMSFADIVFAADDARIGYPPVRAMSTPDVPVLAWKMTMARAKYLQLTGNSVDGKTAAEWGWIAKSFPAAELQEHAWNEAEALSSVDAGLLAANKHQVNQAYEIMGLRTHLAQAWMWHYLSSTARPDGNAFFDQVKDVGMKEALTWMNGPFNQRGLI